ncbi:MAG: divalent-cation tolerance protein CutA [Promethearchaeota archaeon]|nr:MAG: divalent-cation tolerance protein CutA [Candidatus Lokiarchaeota archaeon]
MADNDNYIFLVTAPSIEEARKIGNYLVKNRIAACTNIVNNIESIYRWKAKIQNDKEILLIIKTTEDRSNELIDTIERIHSYDTPECIGFKILKGSEKYLKWLSEST